MKSSKINRSIAVLLILALCILPISAFADWQDGVGVSSGYDQANLSPDQVSQIEDYSAAYFAAEASGNQAAMDAAHDAAEDIRATSNYSGGTYGDEYHPWDDGGDSGYTPPPTTYTITASAGIGGTVSPSGTSSATAGSSATYNFAANTGYGISNVTVDGAAIGAVINYSFSNITASHTINVAFNSIASLSADSAVMGDGGANTLAAGVTKSGYGLTASIPVNASFVTDTTVTASYNFTSPQTVSLEYVNGTWQFPVNSSSATGARKIYIPVETTDGAYTITFTITALDPQATALTGSNVYLTSTQTATVTINGSMYDDDFTGNG